MDEPRIHTSVSREIELLTDHHQNGGAYLNDGDQSVKVGNPSDRDGADAMPLPFDETRWQLPREHPLQDTIFEDIVVYQRCCGVKASQNDDEPSNGVMVTAKSVIQSAAFRSRKLDRK
jgi:hypothetical protein